MLYGFIHRECRVMRSRRTPFLYRCVLLGLVASWPLMGMAQGRMNDTGMLRCGGETSFTGTVSRLTPDPEPIQASEQDCTIGAAAADVLGWMVKVGGSSVPGRDYTKIGNDGRVLPASAALGPNAADWACTRDNVTGLVWELKLSDPASLRHAGHTYTWFDNRETVNGGDAGFEDGAGCGGTMPRCNTAAYLVAINGLTGANRLCGASDWRLPTVQELSGLVFFDVNPGPAIDTVWFPNTVNDFYWSAQNYAPNPAAAWQVGFIGGPAVHVSKRNSLAVRLVRGGP
jgi:hypothetical protein